MRILVTGGAGYIGSILVPMLLSAEHEVVVIDNFLYGQVPLLEYCANPKFHLVQGDVRDRVLMRNNLIVLNPDIIIPLACLTGAPICDKWPKEAREVIVDSLEVLFEYRLPHQKIIYPTTNSGYGIGDEGIYCTEESPLRPVSLYGRLKVEAEKMILSTNNAITLRLATAFGASPRMRLDLLVNDFVFKAVNYSEIKLFEPHFKRNFIHVRDIAKAFLFCLDHWDKMKNNVYNVGLSDVNLSKLELCQKIRKHIQSLRIIEGEGKDPDQRNYIVSNKKIERAGFAPKFSLDFGIEELIKCFKIVHGNKHEVLFSNNPETSA